MKLYVLVPVILCLSACVYSQPSQTYGKGKIHLKNGVIFISKPLIMMKDSCIVTIDRSEIKYSLQDVLLIEAKRGWSKYWAGGFGVGGFVITFTNGFSSASDTLSGGQIILGSIMGGVVFAGLGAAIGALSDRWKVVYTNNYMLREDTRIIPVPVTQ